MLCRCCKYDVANGKATCPVCGFPTLGDTGSEMQSYIQEYRKNKLADISIHVKTYCYQVDGNDIFTESAYTKFADAADLEMDKVIWFNKEFEKFESDREITIDIRICRQGGEDRTANVTFSPDRAISHSGLGIILDAGFTIRFAIGDKNEYILTDPVIMMDSKQNNF